MSAEYAKKVWKSQFVHNTLAVCPSIVSSIMSFSICISIVRMDVRDEIYTWCFEPTINNIKTCLAVLTHYEMIYVI
jgi:ABC-type phosphate transport system permease subunit